MNLVLFEDCDLLSPTELSLDGRRAQHIYSIHRSEVGDTVKVGKVNGAMGEGVITRLEKNRVEIRFELNQAPPKKLPVKLIVALPRPKSLKKVLHITASSGVSELHVCHAYKVDKSYWQSPVLKEESVRDHLILGLEQGVDTVLPTVQFHRYFKPFIEDVVPGIANNQQAFIAHPGSHDRCPCDRNEPVVIAIGPEGGFIDYEVDKFRDQGFQPVTLGDRILRVEFAIASVLGRLF